MRRLFYLFIFFFGLFESCNTNQSNTCKIDYTSVYNGEVVKFLNPLKVDSGVILYDKGIQNSVLGGEYMFDKSGVIVSYRFFPSKEGFTYAEYFDEKGRFKSTVGVPIVFTNVDEIDRDSVKFNYYVSCLGKELKSFKIKLNDSGWVSLHGARDSVFSNTVRFEFPFKCKECNSITVKEELIYARCGGGEMKAVDSIHINRNK